MTIERLLSISKSQKTGSSVNCVFGLLSQLREACIFNISAEFHCFLSPFIPAIYLYKFIRSCVKRALGSLSF